MEGGTYEIDELILEHAVKVCQWSATSRLFMPVNAHEFAVEIRC